MPGVSDSHEDSYYRRLRLARAVSHDDIVRAYRRLALSVHPDAHPEDPDAAARFREITEAYEVLADPRRRADYDRRVLGGGVPVDVHDATVPGAGRAAGGSSARHEGEPVVLGSTLPEPAGDVPLRVGPVRVHRTGEPLVEAADPGTPDLQDLVLRIVDSWWWR